MAADDDDPAQEAEPGPDPTAVQREPERHEALSAVGPNGKPYGGDDSENSHDDVERSPDARAVQFVGGGVVLHPHTGHGHEDQQQSREPQQTGRDHQGAGRLDVRWQGEDLVECGAVVQSRSDCALGPQPLGPQLIHADAHGRAVVACAHPVIGCCGNDEANPSGAAAEQPSGLSAHVRHTDRRYRRLQAQCKWRIILCSSN